MNPINILNLRPKKNPEVVVIKKEILKPRSLSFQVMRMLLVALIVITSVWGISKADELIEIQNESPIEVSAPDTVNEPAQPEQAIEQTPAEEITADEAQTPTDEQTQAEETTEPTSDTTPEQTQSTETPSTTQDQTSTSSDGFVNGVVNTTKDILGAVKDAITITAEGISNLFTASSTPETDLAAQKEDEIIKTLGLTDEEIDNLATSTVVFMEEKTDTGKLVTVSAPNESTSTPIVNVLATTTIPEIYSVGEEDKIQIKWKNEGDQQMSFFATDTDGNGKLDLVEWTIPHLSTQVFEIIFISKAFQLDSSLNIISDIYDTVKEQDGNYATLSDGQYIRATFEQILNNNKDVTVFAKATDSNSPASIEVYPVYTNTDGTTYEGTKVATIENITDAKTYKTLLTELAADTDVFDLKIKGNIEIDFVVDPSLLGTLYFKNVSGDLAWENPVNWFTDATATNQSTTSPWIADDMTKDYDLALSDDAVTNSHYPIIDPNYTYSVSIGNGFVITGESNIPNITNFYSSIYGGTFTGSYFNNYSGTINGGTFTGSGFTNSASIYGGTFTGSDFNNYYGTINGGTFTGSYFNNNSGTINGGTFTVDYFTNNGTIYGGTFTGDYFTNSGTINGGTWAESYILNSVTFPASGTYTNPGFNHEIPLLNLDKRLYWKNVASDGLWNNTQNWFTDANATIPANNVPWVVGDTTYLDYNLSMANGESSSSLIDTEIITEVTGTCDIYGVNNTGTINGGTFTVDYFTNNGTINGGTFTGSYFDNYYGTINGGTFTGSGFTNSASIYGGWKVPHSCTQL